MKNSLSVLQFCDAIQVNAQPFPHVVVRPALPEPLYVQLASTYPSLRRLGVDPEQNNHRWDYSAWRVRRNLLLPIVWRSFIAYHRSQAFFREIIEIFGSHIVRTYPQRFPSVDLLSTLRVGLRRVHRFGYRDILLDAMISGNTPVKQAGSVRTAHVDSGQKLFSGLFYMRRPEDDSIGGDLELCRFASRFSTDSEKLSRFEGQFVKQSDINVVKTVTYAANTLVLFINSVNALHAVTVRQPTPHPRLFVNLVGELDQSLYPIPSTLAKGELVYAE